MSKELRAGLEREAARNNRALSQEVEHRLRNSMYDPDWTKKLYGPPHNKAVGEAVSVLARRIEQATNTNWRESPFAFEALRIATERILLEYAPPKWTADGSYEAPEVIEKRAQNLARHWPEQADLERKPEGVASRIANGLLDNLQNSGYPPLGHPKNQHYSEEFYLLLPKIQEALTQGSQ